MSNPPPFIIIPIVNSAGYAIDQIGMVIEYARQNNNLGNEIAIGLCADERYTEMVKDSAGNLNLRVTHPYTRQNFPSGSSIIDGPLTLATNQAGADTTIVTTDEIARRLQTGDTRKYTLIESPAGLLLADPIAWIQTDATKASAAKSLLDQAAAEARTSGGIPDAKVHFLFFFGGKSLTDSEQNPDAKRIGGMAKSIGADDHIPGILALQAAARSKDLLIVPIFAQYGERPILQERIDEFNQTGAVIPPVTNLGEAVDWNTFEKPSAIIAAAQRYYGATVIGNGSTLQHLAAAAVPVEAGLPIFILRPSWTDVRGEDRWDAAMDKGRVRITTATSPVGIGYDQIMQMVKDDPSAAARVIRAASRNVCTRAYAELIDNMPFMLNPHDGRISRGPQPAGPKTP